VENEAGPLPLQAARKRVKKCGYSHKGRKKAKIAASSDEQASIPSCPSVAATLPAAIPSCTCCSEQVAHLVSAFRTLLLSHVSSHPECSKYAPLISKYMRNQFTFMGLKAPARRELQKKFINENTEGLKERRVLIEFVKCLWDQDERDFQAFGVDLMVWFRDVLIGDTEEEFYEAVGVAEHCVVTKSWWDTVDALAYSGAPEGYFPF